MADFVRFWEEENQDECLENNQKYRLSDAQLIDMSRQNSEYQNLGELFVEKRNQFNPTDSAGNGQQYPSIESGAGSG